MHEAHYDGQTEHEAPSRYIPYIQLVQERLEGVHLAQLRFAGHGLQEIFVEFIWTGM